MKKTFEDLQDSIGEIDLFDQNKEQCNIAFTNFRHTPNEFGYGTATFDVTILPKYYDDDQMAFNNDIYIINCDSKYSENASIYSGGYDIGTQITQKSFEKPKAYCYFSQDALLNIVYCESLK